MRVAGGPMEDERGWVYSVAGVYPVEKNSSKPSRMDCIRRFSSLFELLQRLRPFNESGK